MKRLFVILAVLMLAATSVSAKEKEHSVNADETAVDIVPGMKYKNLKKIYDYKDYSPSIYDTQSPAGMGVASFFIPGLGQMISGEAGRGLLWLGGSAVSYVAMLAGAVVGELSAYYGEDPLAIAGYSVFFVGMASMITIDVCSIVDAVRVAKVKNMYQQDLYKKYSFDVDLHPSVNYIHTAAGVQPTAGLTLALKF